MKQYPYTLNYSGRLIDIELLQSISKPVEVQRVNVAVVTQQPKIVTGIEKLAQRYASTLLTVIGTVHFDVTHGSELLQDIGGGVVQNVGVLNSVFALANDQVIRQMRIDDQKEDIYGTLPDDERLVSGILLDSSVDFTTSTALLKVQLTTRAGDNIVFVVPTTTPR